MAPNSRPPLTSRIRASFEGRRKSFDGTRKLSKSGRTTSDGQEARSPHAIDTEVSSPLHTNGFITQDPESIRIAVDQAINGETFQNAIAANLAKLIKPSIKSALDTIQPVVEAVYSHEILLRKTNQSVEDILTRLDPIAESARRESFIDSTYVPPGAPADGEKSADAVERPVASREVVAGPDFNQFKQLLEEKSAKTAETLSGLSTIVESNTTRIAEVAEGVADLNTALGPTKGSIDSLKSSFEQANTTTSVLQAQLDQLKEDIGQIIEAIGKDLGKNIQAISEQSGAHDASLLSTHTTKLDLISTDLAVLKGHGDTVEKIESISTELSALKATVAAGNASNTESFANILTAVEDHSTVLSSLKDAPAHPDILSALQQSNGSHTAHTAALTEIRERSLGSAAAPVTVSESGSVDHSAALQELKSDLEALKENILAGLSSNNENVTGLGTKIESVVTAIEGPNAEILAAVKLSNESHEKHAVALEGIKSITPAEAAPAVDNSDLGEKISTVVAKLDEHSTALEEIKAFGGSHSAALEGIKLAASIEAAPAAGSSDLAEKIGVVVAKLDEHTAALTEIKGIGGAHSTALEGIKSIAPEPAPAADVSDLSAQISDIVARLEAHSATLNEIKGFGGSHAAALASHGNALEGIKSLGVSAPAEGGNVAGLETQIAAIVATLEGHGAALDEIKGRSSVLDAIKISTDSHATALESHGTVLENIKALGDAPPAEGSSPAALETQIADVITKLDAHGAVLDEIKAHSRVLDEIKTTTSETWKEIKARNTPSSTAVVLASDASEQSTTEGPFGTIVETLMLHTNLLNEIKEDVSAEILTALHEIGQAQANHTNLLTEIREADLSDEILTLLHASGESHTASSTALEKVQAALLALDEKHVAHATSLDEIKSRSVEPAAPGAEGLEAHITSIVAKLQDHSAALDAIKESHISHSTTLGEIKSRSLEPPTSEVPAVDLSGLESQIGGIATKLEDHTAVLTAIRDATSASKDSHSSHTAVLGEIKDATLASNESHAAHATALEEIKTTTDSLPDLYVAHTAHAVVLSEIKNAALLSNESHTSHSTVLSELKSLTSTLNDNHNTHATALSEIRDATLASNEAHASHATAFTELKSLQHTSPPADSSDNSALETHLTSILRTLESQTATLTSIKDSTTTANPDIISAIANSHSLLEAHGPLLEAIKERSSHTDILATISELKSIVEDSKADLTSHGVLVKDLHAETKDSHSNLASAIGALALGGAAGAGTTALLSHDDDESSKEVLQEVKAVRALVESSSANVDATKDAVTTIASQIDINHTTITTSITTLSDELKAEIDATGTNIAESITALDTDIRAIDVSPLNAHLQQHGQDLKSLSSQIDTLDNTVKETGTHVLGLHDGVHFNEKGVDQLKEHVVSTSGGAAAEPISEGAWFGSKSPRLSRAVSRSAVEPEPIAEELPEPRFDVVEKAIDSEPEPNAEELPEPQIDTVGKAIDSEPVVEINPILGEEVRPEVVEEIVADPSDFQLDAIEKEVPSDPGVVNETISKEDLAVQVVEESLPAQEEIVEPESILEVPVDDRVIGKSIDKSEPETPIEDQAGSQELVEVETSLEQRLIPEESVVEQEVKARPEVVEPDSTIEVQVDDPIVEKYIDDEPKAPIQEEAQQPSEEVIEPESTPDDESVADGIFVEKEVEAQAEPEIVEPETSLEDPVVEQTSLPEEKQNPSTEVIESDEPVLAQEIVTEQTTKPETVVPEPLEEQQPIVEQETTLDPDAEVPKDVDEAAVVHHDVFDPVIEPESLPAHSDDIPIDDLVTQEASPTELVTSEEKAEESLPLDDTPAHEQPIEATTQEGNVVDGTLLPSDALIEGPVIRKVANPEPETIEGHPTDLLNTDDTPALDIPLSNLAQDDAVPDQTSLPGDQVADKSLDAEGKDIEASEPEQLPEHVLPVDVAPPQDENVVVESEVRDEPFIISNDLLPDSKIAAESKLVSDDVVNDLDDTPVVQYEQTEEKQEPPSHVHEDPTPESSDEILEEAEVDPVLETHVLPEDTQPLSEDRVHPGPSELVDEDSALAAPLDKSTSPVVTIEDDNKPEESLSDNSPEADLTAAPTAAADQQPSDILDGTTSVKKDEFIPGSPLEERAPPNESIGHELEDNHVRPDTPVFKDLKDDSLSVPTLAENDEREPEPESVKEMESHLDHPTSAPIDDNKLDDDKSQAAQEEPAEMHSLDDLDAKDANFPLAAPEIDRQSSPSVESPVHTKLDEQHLAPESPEDNLSPTISRSFDPTDDEPHTAPSSLPLSHQSLTDPTLDGGHATPLDEARSNPFEDPDNLLSPAYSPDVEDRALSVPDIGQRSPVEPPLDEDFENHGSETNPPTPASPVIRQQSPLQSLEDDGDRSPDFASHAPHPETVSTDLRQGSPQTQPFDDPHSSLPPHLQLNAPSPGFPDIRQRSPDQPFEDEGEEVVSPSSEFAVPITPGLKEKTPAQPYDSDNPDSRAFPAFKGQDVKGQEVVSPPLASPADFGFREDAAFPDLKGKGKDAEVSEGVSREETETEPESALASPTSPVFSEGGTEVKGKKGKKGKKEKKDKKGKGKKEKVPFEMEGEDAE